MPLIAIVRPRILRATSINLLGQRAIQDFVHQGRFAAARNAGHHRQQSQRNLHVDVFQIVLGRADNRQFLAVRAPSHGGTGISSAPARYCPVRESGFCAIALRRAGRHQFAAQPPRARPQVDHVIGALNGLGIVLHHQHRVAHVAQVRERIQQPLVIARMQPDGRLVQHVQHAAQLRPDLRRQTDALRLAAGKRGRRAFQAEIIQPDRREKLQPPPDLVHDAAGDLHFAVAELPVAHASSARAQSAFR